MRKFAHVIVKFRKWIIVIATKINYDILTYLPSDLDSMVGCKFRSN